jgi:hypothetical protein
MRGTCSAHHGLAPVVSSSCICFRTSHPPMIGQQQRAEHQQELAGDLVHEAEGVGVEAGSRPSSVAPSRPQRSPPRGAAP